MVTAWFRLRPVAIAALVCAAVAAAGCGSSGTGGPVTLNWFVATQQPTGNIAAAAVIVTVPIILFVLFFQRRIVAGLTAGAVKG